MNQKEFNLEVDKFTRKIMNIVLNKIESEFEEKSYYNKGRVFQITKGKWELIKTFYKK